VKSGLSNPQSLIPNPLSLADSWWDIAQQSDSKDKEGLLLRAGYWYQQAAGDIDSDALRLKVEKRLAAISKLGLEAVVAVHATVKPPAASLDKALALIARGQGEQVAAHLPQLLQELIPLLQLATPEQRWVLLKQIG